MKKLVALLLAVLMLATSAMALAEAPEGYPAVVEGIDFGGRTVKMYSWYTQDRKDNPSTEEQDLYDYQDWIQSTYNVKVEWVASEYDWAASINYLTDFVTNAVEPELAIFMMPMDFIGPALKNNLLAPLQDVVDLEKEQWNDGTTEFMTSNGNTLGLWAGASEPRECVFFNVQMLKDAGIEPDEIYDAQANGTWTWDYFLELCAKIQKDVDGDGVVDTWATVGSGDDLLLASIINNGGCIYNLVDGKLTCQLGSENVLEALQFTRTIRDNYFRKAQTDAEGNTESWDYYKQAFVQGQGAFRFGQTWEGFNGNEAMNVDGFEWGCVMFPTGPKAEKGAYKSAVNDNIICIPNVYKNAEDVKLLGFLLDLWYAPTPGYEDDTESWIGNKYDYTDDRAVEETYAMMREAEHTVRDCYCFLGDKNTVLGPDLFWAIDSQDPAALVESVLPVFESRADDFNK